MNKTTTLQHEREPLVRNHLKRVRSKVIARSGLIGWRLYREDFLLAQRAKVEASKRLREER